MAYIERRIRPRQSFNSIVLNLRYQPGATDPDYEETAFVLESADFRARGIETP